ncbi:hypothetical protein [Algivirga pacifica]|uniref:Uncharacterized protein n=1 Tax=Algivirga pacifica TaxID=1162670 RepID=A0ABP9D9D5_9BACT
MISNLKILVLSILFTYWITPLCAAEIKLSGVYKGSNLYIENPIDESGTPCVQEVYVNGKKQLESPKQRAFILDLSHLHRDQDIDILIVHNEGCTPKVINPNAIKKVAGQFIFSRSKVDDDKIVWTTSGEIDGGYFLVMKWLISEWEEVKMVSGKGSERYNFYSIPVRHHEGLNQYKIIYIKPDGKVTVSPMLEINSEQEMVTFYPKRVEKELFFSRMVKYSVMDIHGKVVLKGEGDVVDCSALSKGKSYYLTYDNKTGKFYKE